MRLLDHRPFNTQMDSTGFLFTSTQGLKAEDFAIICRNDPVATSKLNY
jgi:hypothetical protein